MQSHHLSHRQIIKNINYKTIIIFFLKIKVLTTIEEAGYFKFKMTIHIQETENHSQELFEQHMAHTDQAREWILMISE
jgi:hypothetical protein